MFSSAKTRGSVTFEANFGDNWADGLRYTSYVRPGGITMARKFHIQRYVLLIRTKTKFGIL